MVWMEQTFQLRANLAPKHVCGGKTLITFFKYNWHTICEDQHTAFGERLNNTLNAGYGNCGGTKTFGRGGC